MAEDDTNDNYLDYCLQILQTKWKRNAFVCCLTNDQKIEQQITFENVGKENCQLRKRRPYQRRVKEKGKEDERKWLIHVGHFM